MGRSMCGGEWEMDGEQGDGSVGDGAGPMNSSPPCLMCPDNLLTTADYGWLLIGRPVLVALTRTSLYLRWVKPPRLRDSKRWCPPSHSSLQDSWPGTVDGMPRHSRTAGPLRFLW